MHDGSLTAGGTLRYGRKREAIVAAATQILNRRGVKGMTLAQVADLDDAFATLSQGKQLGGFLVGSAATGQVPGRLVNSACQRVAGSAGYLNLRFLDR